MQVTTFIAALARPAKKIRRPPPDYRPIHLNTDALCLRYSGWFPKLGTITSEILLLLIAGRKYAMLPTVEKHFLTSQPTQMVRPGRILEQEGFGQKAKSI